ncbi:dipeptidase 1 (renal) [Physocladia obscura]|uniref:Dipeptidase n=1 Tax=Physocladia obscura TaxID=109957 RepID=A0AAD5T3S1_9FUNG|nr:dipeptidase 1 (renal) [Physocladia obscura]
MHVALVACFVAFTIDHQREQRESVSESQLWTSVSGARAEFSVMRLGETPIDAALRILKYAPIIDTHNDWPGALSWGPTKGVIKNADLNNLPPTQFHTDITRLREGRVGAQFWSAYVACSEFHRQDDSIKNTLTQIDLIKRIVNKYSKTFGLARTVADIRYLVSHGKIASLIGIEGGHQIDGSMAVLRQYYELGVRYMTLTHTCHTAWTDSCQGTPIHGGLTKDGYRFINEMNRLGMMVDISHVSPDSMQQAIEASAAPTIFSHSSSFAITPVPRNVPDNILELLPKYDGVVMIAFVNDFIRVNATVPTSVNDLAEHIEHIKSVAGVEHIGLGADFDGSGINDFAIKDTSKYPELIAELIRRKFTEKEIVGITGGNLLRVMEKVEAVARKLKRDTDIEEIGVTVEKQCFF